MDDNVASLLQRPPVPLTPAMRALSATVRSRVLGRVLAGAWRAQPPALRCSGAELEALVPLLLDSGAAPLAWWKVRDSPLAASPAGQALQHAYRQAAIGAVLHDRIIAQVVRSFQQVGIDPILVKGWAVSRLYPRPGLRPYGDIDLCVPPAHHRAAQRILDEAKLDESWVDLHYGFAKLDSTPLEALYKRSELVPLAGCDVRLLRPEDHLRVLCLHLLRHGAWRPLWLCDVATLVETRPADFDWDICLGTGNRADAVASAVGLAHRLLGLRVADLPPRIRDRPLPFWMLAAVLKKWEAPYPGHQPPANYGAPLVTYLRRPAALPAALRRRWPDPIASTFFLGAPYNNLPRLPFQMAYSLRRLARFVSHLDED